MQADTPGDDTTLRMPSMPKPASQPPTSVEAGAADSPTGVISVAFSCLGVYAFGRKTDYQRTLTNFLAAQASMFMERLKRKPHHAINILDGIDGLVQGGEMLLVLGNPGSGCTTLLKSLSGHTDGLIVDDRSILNFQGVPSKQMFTAFRGKTTYQAEFDIHFPTLTMRETLEFASKARTRPERWDACSLAVEDEARMLGLRQALDTYMGNALLPGLPSSSNAHKEIMLGDGVFQCWDNSTRGLDSVNALDFVKAVRRRTSDRNSVAIVTLYQAGEDIYKLFDKVIVLHEGRQIYFGPTQDAKKYFTDMGFNSPPRCPTPEFLTSVTRPLVLRPNIRDGVSWVPRNALQFAKAWRSSPEYKALLSDIDGYNEKHPLENKSSVALTCEALAGHDERRSAFILLTPKQIGLCIDRGFLRLRHNLPVLTSTIVGNLVISIILGSMFYSMKDDTSSFFGCGVLLFFTSLINTTLAAFESVALWDDRPVIEKHSRYRFYHPFTEAVASFLCDVPNKIVLTFAFNLPVYFLSNLRRTPGAFFTYYLFGFMCLLNGSVIYRSMGAMSRTLVGSQPPGAVLVALMTIYSGFVLPLRDMRPWLQWFSYINPVYYASRAVDLSAQILFHRAIGTRRTSSVQPLVLDLGKLQYLEMLTSRLSLGSIHSIFGGVYNDFTRCTLFVLIHLFRNLGILMATLSVAACVYLLATEYISMLPPRPDVFLFQRLHMPDVTEPQDLEGGAAVPRDNSEKFNTSSQKTASDVSCKSRGAHLVWSNLTYEIKDGKEKKVILHDIDGWGSSGAGKTTLLNVLAERTTIGVVNGNISVDTRHQNIAFARKIGYAQQDDIHLETASVREVLLFSALLRQPSHYSKQEKIDFVDQVIDMLDMRIFQHAVVGRLNIEQKKRVTIGTELAARPELLLFLDEPTSGLDSDSAWSFCNLLKRLTSNGQAILCTIHQPSSPLLGLFDRLLLLDQGQAIYFGSLGHEFRDVIHYFERHGARKCPSHENPAEWMMEITRDDATDNGMSWGSIWKESMEHDLVRQECDDMEQRLSNTAVGESSQETQITEFATPFWDQLAIVTKRAFEHDWRSPGYIYSKSLTTFGTAFINGLSFWASGTTSQDIQNQVFSLFLLLTIFGTHVQLIMARLHDSRVLYENRERQSRTYSWAVFIISNVIVELASQTLISVICFVSWYYPLGLWRKALNQGELHSRSGLVFLLIWSLLVLFQTFSQMLMTIMPDVPTGINIGNVLFMLSLIFSGVLVPPNDLPRFWIFMYRATPLSYYVSAVMSTGLSGTDIECSSDDILRFDPPAGQSCGSYIEASGTSRILNPNDESSCEVCMYTTADSLLSYFGIYFEDRWWQWGVTIAYNVFNVVFIFLLYWLVKVPKISRRQR
ncbi:hypothetical protein NM208_g4402 [Fusarium decemcellulare]|uniref:Uncharacterized protein n=1 Tax=Fusarium decemcellulare TaxID=57161 RepID=A0ACC1SL77_9HYPO|nr:hypothetical protein NM208_g4402 [Fusarium decemcellulare]